MGGGWSVRPSGELVRALEQLLGREAVGLN